jgi:adenylate cyclase class 2
MIEVELKCELTPAVWERLRERLRDMKLKGVVHNLDIYYDTSQYDLLKQAVFVRVRNGNRLEFKFNEHAEQAHVQCSERHFPLEPGPELTAKMNTLFTRFLPRWRAAPQVPAAIAENCLIELARIDNHRECYSNDLLEVSIDHVVGIGNFFELETRCKDKADTNRALSMLSTFASEVGAQHIQVGYVELWLRTHNEQAYQLGKYRLG